MIGTEKMIQLLKVVNTKTTSGNWQSAKTKYTYWAEVVRGSGSRNYQNSQTQLGGSYTFKIRYKKSLDLSAKWLIVYDGKQFTITGITKVLEKSFWYVIEAVEKNG